MRHVLLAGVVPLALSTMSVAHAEPSAPPGASQLRPLAISELPERCRELARVPASALIPDPDMAAHISVANCMAEEVMGRLALQPDSPSVAALDSAAEASVQILDDVITHGSPRWRLIADTAKADLYRGMAVRMRSAMSGRDAAPGAEASLSSWLARAALASRDAANVARTEPIGDDAVVRSVLAGLVAAGDAPPRSPVATDDASRAGPNLTDPDAVRRLHRAIAADQLVIKDRDRRDAAQTEITADTRLLKLDVQRVAAVRAAWHRATDGGEYASAATLARAHFDAMSDEKAVRASLVRARASYDAALTQLALDQQHLRDVEARGPRNLRSSTSLDFER